MDFLLVIYRRWLLCLLCFGLAIPVAAQATLEDVIYALQNNDTLNGILYALQYHEPYGADYDIGFMFHNYMDVIHGDLDDVNDMLWTFHYHYLQDQSRIEDHEVSVENSLDGLNNNLGYMGLQLQYIRQMLGMGDESWFSSISGDLAYLSQQKSYEMNDAHVLMYDSSIPPEDVPLDQIGEPPDEDVGPGPPDDPDVDEIANTYLDGEEALAESGEKAAQTEEAFAEAVEEAFEDISNETGDFNSVFVIDYDLPSLPRILKPINLHLELDFAGKDFKVFRDASSGLFSVLWLALYIFAVWMFVRHEIDAMIAN